MGSGIDGKKLISSWTDVDKEISVLWRGINSRLKFMWDRNLEDSLKDRLGIYDMRRVRIPASTLKTLLNSNLQRSFTD